MSLKKIIRSLACCTLLCVGLTLSVSATDFSDLPTDHWAYEDMMHCVKLGVMSGTGEGQMSPDAPLNWGQFLTMISRAANPRAYVEKLEDGIPWDQAGYELAREEGLLKKRDTLLDISTDELDRPITRREVAILIYRFTPESVFDTWSWLDAVEYPYQDTDHLTKQEHTMLWDMFNRNIMTGKGNGIFGPDDVLKRSEGGVVLSSAIQKKDSSMFLDVQSEVDLTMVDADGTVLGRFDAVPCRIGDQIKWFSYDYMPEGYVYVAPPIGNKVSSACTSYTFQIRPMNEFELMEQDARERYEKGELTREEYLYHEFWLYKEGTNDAKNALVEGSFASKEQADAAMARVTVPIWKLSGGQKVSSTATITVQAPIAPIVERIFTEIYNDPEQFPINSVGGYSWRGTNSSSTHCEGLAIDINPNENYQVKDGIAMVGSFWKPGENPYSMSEDGSVVRTFKKYGWSWLGDSYYGSDPKVGYHDYMHFSFFYY